MADGSPIRADVENISLVNNDVDAFYGLSVIKKVTGSIKNVTIANNNASVVAYLTYLVIESNGTLDLSNMTIAHNTVQPDQLAALLALVQAGTLNYKNILLADNTASGTNVNCNPSYLNGTDLGGNLSDDDTCTSSFTQPTDKNNVNPALGSLTLDNGQYIMPLQDGSPAIDAGIAEGAPATDQRGVARPQGAGVDIGAYEFVASGGNVADNDNDGISDTIEDTAPNNGDGNADGTPDKNQSRIVSLPSASSGKYLTLVGPLNSSFTDVSATNYSTLNKKDSYEYPYGLVGFSLSGITPAASADIELIVHDDQTPSKFTGRKFVASKQQFVSPSSVAVTSKNIGAGKVLSLRYSIVDGSSNDDDGTANGVIVDPVGLASGGATTLPATGVWIILVPFLLAVLVSFVYILYDWRRHRKPLLEQNPHVHYTLSHHIQIVIIPKLNYRLRERLMPRAPIKATR